MKIERPSPQFIKMSPLDRSTLAALATKDVTQYLRATKLILRQYLQECVAATGQYRQFFDKVASYTIGYHVNEELDDDPNKRHLQIADFYDQVAERPPQIFIQDGGYEYTPSSLGSLAAGWGMNTRDGHQICRVLDVVPIPIDITCVAQSVQEVEDLAAFLTAAFGQLCRFTSNYIIRPQTTTEGAYWELRIPLVHTIGPKAHSALHEHPQLQFWQISCTATFDFENSVFLQYRSQPTYLSKRGELALTVPDTLVVGQEFAITLVNKPKPVAVYSDDARIAVVQERGFELIIHPRRVGTFNLIVAKTAGPHTGPEILTQQQITIKAR